MLGGGGAELRLPGAGQAAVRGRAASGSARAAWCATAADRRSALVAVGRARARRARGRRARLRLVGAAGARRQPRELRLAGRGRAAGRRRGPGGGGEKGRAVSDGPRSTHCLHPHATGGHGGRAASAWSSSPRRPGSRCACPRPRLEKHELDAREGRPIGADPTDRHGPRAGARRRRHDPDGAARVRGHGRAGVRDQLRRDRVPRHGRAVASSRRACAARSRGELRRDGAARPDRRDRGRRAAGGQRRLASTAARTGAWRSWPTRSRASSSARCAATGSWSPPPAGSTGYNLANGGPVLAWGVEGFVVSFIAPHTLTARALVVAPGRRRSRSRTARAPRRST